ncbi:hypothetical protein Tco_0181734, partial [Tanacetum coccineum]
GCGGGVAAAKVDVVTMGMMMVRAWRGGGDGGVDGDSGG